MLKSEKRIISSWQLKQIQKLHIYFVVFNTTSSVKTEWLYRFYLQNLFTIVFSKKNEKKNHETFHKVFQFWKQKHISKMKAHLEKEIWISIEIYLQKKRLSINMSV